MGVLRRIEPKQPRSNTPTITYEDYVFDDEIPSDLSDNESEEEEQRTQIESAPVTPARRRRQKDSRTERKIRRFLDLDAQNGGMKVKRRMGARKLRRLENARLMYSLADPDDICDDFSDILTTTVSAFAQLFIERQNMLAWNEFIEKDEEEQRAFLESTRHHHGSHEPGILEEGHFDGQRNRLGGRRERRTMSSSCSASDGGSSNAKNRQQHNESRQHHPAYSAAACFSRLDQRFKSIFIQKRLPWSFIAETEQELRSHFLAHESPGALWHSGPITSSWHRLLLHGVSQYLSLHSISIQDNDSDENAKSVRVRNPRNYFIPPHNNLVAYISELHKNERRKWSTGF